MPLKPGSVIPKDPDSEIPYIFDWTVDLGAAAIATSVFLVSGPDALLTYDNATIVTGNLKTQVRVKGGTPGARYRFTNRIVTNESLARTDDQSVYFVIRET